MFFTRMLFSAARKMLKIVESFADSCITFQLSSYSSFDDNNVFQELRNMAILKV